MMQMGTSNEPNLTNGYGWNNEEVTGFKQESNNRKFTGSDRIQLGKNLNIDTECIILFDGSRPMNEHEHNAINQLRHYFDAILPAAGDVMNEYRSDPYQQ